MVMPNHFHGIISILGDEECTLKHNALRHPALGTLIGTFKQSVTKSIRPISSEFFIVWQRLYWESVIRSEQNYDAVAEYIINNPQNWNKDEFNPDTR